MTRLGFLRMLGMTTMARYGTMGQAHRRPDQMSDPPPSAVAPTQAAGILRARAVVIFGTGPTAGLFVYNGTPSGSNPPQIAIVPTGVTKDPFGNAITSAKILMQGNIITESGGVFRTAAAAPLMQLDGPHNAFLVYDAASVLRETIAPVATNDGLGSTVQSGFTAYAAANTTYAQMVAAALQFHAAGDIALPSISEAANATLSLGSGQTAALTVEALLSLQPAAAGANALLQVQGVVTSDTWHSASGLYVAGFSDGSPASFYRQEPQGSTGPCVRLQGTFTLTANQVAGATVATLPAGYRPVQGQGFACSNNLSGYAAGKDAIDISTGGVITLGVAGTNGNFVRMDGIVFPTDN